MTTPERASDSKYGRVYLAQQINEGAPTPTWANIHSGVWVPSVTNVIDVAGKPFLKQWAARLAAEAAVGAAATHHTQMVNRPRDAAVWAAAAADRHTNAAAELGDLVHNLCEERSHGGTPDVPEAAKPYMRAWEQFIADFAPTFTAIEATVYGNVSSPDGDLGYAGTADFFATIQGTPFVGDYKSGRYVHDSAALQLAALANAEPPPGMSDGRRDRPHSGLVVHLTPSGYRVHQTDTHAGSPGWDAFQHLRRVWDFHVRSLAARQPTLLHEAVSHPDALIHPAHTANERTS